MLPPRTSLALALFAVTAARSPALASPGATGSFGVVAGYQATSADFDVISPRSSDVQPTSGGLVLLRGGLALADVFAFELTAGLAIGGTHGDAGTAILAPVHLDAVWRVLGPPVTPYLALGGGVYANLAGPGSFDADGLLHGALGMEWRPSRGLALRVEASVYGTDGIESGFSWTPCVTFGVDILAGAGTDDDLPADDADAWRAPPPSGPKDSDGDGVVDASDTCPAAPGVASLDGCPDTDGDGVADVFDRCPVDPGRVPLAGCSDRDGDGILDDEDACPERAGRTDSYGCPR
ncbi:MAG: thrombospondin type 3 repeat-containing protein [Deltaproteobacteria bacterium]|nr:thrombospondin type 3 repeat-containing protein [Deltaproteobacteria bacterium]